MKEIFSQNFTRQKIGFAFFFWGGGARVAVRVVNGKKRGVNGEDWKGLHQKSIMSYIVNWI